MIEDDVDLRRSIESALSEAGADVYTAADGEEGLRELHACRPDLIILGVTMPEMDNWETLRRIRQLSDVPVILLSPPDRENDIFRGLEHGADDFVIKPFDVKMLVMRVQVALRRASASWKREEPIIYEDDRLTIDLRGRRVLVEGEPADLTPKEFQVLAYLLQNAGRLVTVRQLLKNIWGWENEEDPGYVRIYIWRLRQKLEEDPEEPQYLVVERGVGYKFQEE